MFSAPLPTAALFEKTGNATIQGGIHASFVESGIWQSGFGPGKLSCGRLGRVGDFGAAAQSSSRHFCCKFRIASLTAGNSFSTGSGRSRSAVDLVAGGRRASESRLSGRHMLFPPQL
jgi:hypothetical protein